MFFSNTRNDADWWWEKDQKMALHHLMLWYLYIIYIPAPPFVLQISATRNFHIKWANLWTWYQKVIDPPKKRSKQVEVDYLHFTTCLLLHHIHGSWALSTFFALSVGLVESALLKDPFVSHEDPCETSFNCSPIMGSAGNSSYLSYEVFILPAAPAFVGGLLQLDMLDCLLKKPHSTLKPFQET